MPGKLATQKSKSTSSFLYDVFAFLVGSYCETNLEFLLGCRWQAAKSKSKFLPEYGFSAMHEVSEDWDSGSLPSEFDAHDFYFLNFSNFNIIPESRTPEFRQN